jgi:hypothetical protein
LRKSASATSEVVKERAMAEDKKTSEKTLEMRLAELEDKVAKIHITEDELKAYHKVSALMGGVSVPVTAEGGHMHAPTPALSPQLCSISRRVVSPRSINPCIIQPRIWNECICGPCACDPYAGGGGGFGGGFGGFGM